jgi:hypothetical protein
MHFSPEFTAGRLREYSVQTFLRPREGSQNV